MQICAVEYTQNKSHVEVVRNTKIAVVKTSNIKSYRDLDKTKIMKKKHFDIHLTSKNEI